VEESKLETKICSILEGTTVAKALLTGENNEISKQFDIVHALGKLLTEEKESLFRMIKELQESCSHEFESVTEFDPNYLSKVGSRPGQKIFIGSHCSKCDLFVPRPEGYPWQVCHKCGGRMENDGSYSGGMDRIHVVKCENCNHRYEST